MPRVSLIVRFNDATGRWEDEIGQNWNACLPFRLTDLDLFEQWYEQHGRDIQASVAALRKLEEGAEGEEAWERLKQALGQGG